MSDRSRPSRWIRFLAVAFLWIACGSWAKEFPKKRGKDAEGEAPGKEVPEKPAQGDEEESEPAPKKRKKGEGKREDRVSKTAQRPYFVYLPRGQQKSKNYPMVLSATGLTCEGTWELSGWEAAADQHGLIVVAPQMSYSGKDKPPDHEADFQALLEIHSEVVQEFGVNRFAVLATGYSAGGLSASRLAGEHPEKFPFLCLRGGNFFAPPKPPPEKAPFLAAVSVLLLVGEKDPYKDQLAPQAEKCKAFFEAALAKAAIVNEAEMAHVGAQERVAAWFAGELASDAARLASWIDAEKALRSAEAARAQGKAAQVLRSLRPVLARASDPRMQLWGGPLLAGAQQEVQERLARIDGMAVQDPVAGEAAYIEFAKDLGPEEEMGKQAGERAAALKGTPAYEAELLYREALTFVKSSPPDYRITLRLVLKKFPGTPAAAKAEAGLAEPKK